MVKILVNINLRKKIRLLNYSNKNYIKLIDGLIETVEVLFNPKTMKSIARGIEDYKKGRLGTLEVVKNNIYN